MLSQGPLLRCTLVQMAGEQSLLLHLHRIICDEWSVALIVRELACLYVSPAHENQGIGRKLVQYVENRARELGLEQVLTLSTQAFTFFQSKGGFAEGSPDDLPPARREKYDQSGRNSKVLIKRLK